MEVDLNPERMDAGEFLDGTSIPSDEIESVCIKTLVSLAKVEFDASLEFQALYDDPSATDEERKDAALMQREIAKDFLHSVHKIVKILKADPGLGELLLGDLGLNASNEEKSPELGRT